MNDVARLAQLLTVATPEQYAELFPLIKANPAPKTLEDLAVVAATPPPEDLGSVERIAFGQRRANAAVTLLRLGGREKVLPVFEWTDDPEALTQFIFRCRPREVGVEPLLDCLQLVSDGPREHYPRDARYALLLALGEFTLQEIPEARRDTLITQLADWYRHDPSSGVHGAAGWLLRQWGQTETVQQVDQTPVPYAPDREWFTLAIDVTSESQSFFGNLLGSSTKKTFYYTFLVFSAAEYNIGSMNDELEREKDEVRRAVKLTRPFALLDREITFEELIAFSPHYTGYMQKCDAKPVDAGYAADWYDSVGFCRWLGKQMGLSEADQAYSAPESLDVEHYPRKPSPAANWAPREWPVDLSRRGFRLPTEAEWEVACRASARTAYGYGSEVNLLGQFGWFVENSGKHVHPPKELRPNVRGLFDLHGNLFEWTHDRYGVYGTVSLTDLLGLSGYSSRVNRGGSWHFVAAKCRSALRGANVPSGRSDDCGFRLALSPSGGSSPAEQEQKYRAEPACEGMEEKGEEEDKREK